LRFQDNGYAGNIHCGRDPLHKMHFLGQISYMFFRLLRDRADTTMRGHQLLIAV